MNKYRSIRHSTFFGEWVVFIGDQYKNFTHSCAQNGWSVAESKRLLTEEIEKGIPSFQSVFLSVSTTYLRKAVFIEVKRF